MSTNDAFPWPVHPAAELFPLLGDDELRELADDIRQHGLLEPVWLIRSDDGTHLLDGRNRYRACEIAGVELRMRYYDGDDPIGFSLSMNLKRRHLTPGQRDFLALDVEKLYSDEARKSQGKRTDLLPDFPADPPEGSPRERESRERAAKVTGARGRGISAAKRIEREAPDLAKKVKAGAMPLDRADRIIRDRESEQRRIEHARAEAAAQPAPTTVDIRHGDFREVLSELTGIDAIITDPPYPGEFLPLLADLAAWADKVLAPDGIMAVLLGQTHLERSYELLSGHRPYRWTGCCLTPWQSLVQHQRRVHTNWKPLLIYGGGPRIIRDVFQAESGDAGAKSLHKWGQDYGLFHQIIERLTARGQTVADPFMGSGTTLLAARALGRHAIGADIDPASVSTARSRVDA